MSQNFFFITLSTGVLRVILKGVVMSAKETVDLVLHRTGVDIHWLFKHSFWYVEEPKEKWEISWAVRKFLEQEEVPESVLLLSERIISDNQCLFYKRDS